MMVDSGQESFAELPQLDLGVSNEVSGPKEPYRPGIGTIQTRNLRSSDGDIYRDGACLKTSGRSWESGTAFVGDLKTRRGPGNVIGIRGLPDGPGHGGWRLFSRRTGIPRHLDVRTTRLNLHLQMGLSFTEAVGVSRLSIAHLGTSAHFGPEV